MLEKAGFEVCADAKDGEEAVTLARTLKPDLALLDVCRAHVGIDTEGASR